MTAEARGYRGTKVMLRAIERSDLELLRSFVNDPEVMRSSNVFRPISDVEQLAWFEKTVRDPSTVLFGIEDIRTGDTRGKLVGTCTLIEIEPYARQAELRIRIGDKSAWGGGIGKEACRLLIEHGFGALNLERIWLRVFDNNERAQKMYERLGFRVEGRLRRAAYVDGVLRDVVLMGLLRSEWPPS